MVPLRSRSMRKTFQNCRASPAPLENVGDESTSVWANGGPSVAVDQKLSIAMYRGAGAGGRLAAMASGIGACRTVVPWSAAASL